MQWNCSGKIVMVLDPVRIGMEPLPGYEKLEFHLFSLAEELLSGGNSKQNYFHLENLGKISNLTSIFFHMGGSNHQLALCFFLKLTIS